MVDTIYIEQEVLQHPRSERILARFPKAKRIVIERYGEVFNSHAQNFRAQKSNPALILASKKNRRVMPTPSQYETGGGANYYFSHMLNCVYDCRYCFLQGMFRSAHYLLFVNYEDFVQDIKRLAAQHESDAQPVWFFSGYDCDSLAYEPVTQFADFFIQQFAELPNAVLELRSKSTQIRSLLKRRPLENVVVASSLSPDQVAQAVEHGAPSLAKRVRALQRLQEAGWRIGLRFDPIVWHADYQKSYQQMFDFVFAQLDADKIDTVTLGGFRLPKGFYKIMRKLYPEHWVFRAGLAEQQGMIAYLPEIEADVFATISAMCLEHVASERLYCYPTEQPLSTQAGAS